jgi:hypothetical protein
LVGAFPSRNSPVSARLKKTFARIRYSHTSTFISGAIMRRLFVLFAPCILFIAIGCQGGEPGLVLTLPASADPPKHAPERVSKLTIDGVDYTLPRIARREVKVKPGAPNDTVTIEYCFWPNTYTNIIRTKVVTLPMGGRVEADLTAEDPKTPDKIKPIYFPTPHEVVEEMCKLGNIGAGDIVHDIGCGDGRLVVLAVKKFGAKKGVGIDIEEHLVKKSWENAKSGGVEEKVDFRVGDALEIKDFSEASVVLLYVGGDLNKKLQPVLKKTLKPGSRVVSHRFLMNDDWPPDRSITITAKNNYGDNEEYKLHLWTIK